jgi:hypothetical protein
MKCDLCKIELKNCERNRIGSYRICQICQHWILISEKDPFYVEMDKSILLKIYYYYEDLTVVFDFQNNETIFYKDSKHILMKIPERLPITRKVINDIPNKIKLWQTFS